MLAATALSVSVYILWRIFFTIPTRYGIVSLIFGLALIISETASAIEALVQYSHFRNSKPGELPQIPESWFPEVDILIATHNEPADLLYKTINSCAYLDYPDKAKVHIYLCDDRNRPEMAELARKSGVGYFGLEHNEHAKAGNLNNALGQTDSPIVVTVDADMILRRSYLMKTVPYFFLPMMKKNVDGHWVQKNETETDPGEKIGFVQTPQSFYNPDLFQYNLYSELHRATSAKLERRNDQ